VGRRVGELDGREAVLVEEPFIIVFMRSKMRASSMGVKVGARKARRPRRPRRRVRQARTFFSPGMREKRRLTSSARSSPEALWNQRSQRRPRSELS
jgi:hypothetical protein